MPQDRDIAFKIRPVIACPRRAQTGKKYLLTVDLECPDFPTWPYDAEEHVVYCLVESRPLFTCQPVGDSVVVVHRFGGTYGPAQFLLVAADHEMKGSVRISLVNGRGVPIRTVDIQDVCVTRDQVEGSSMSIHAEAPTTSRRASRQSRLLRFRVHIIYEILAGSAQEKVELPFVVGVMADLSGKPAESLPDVGVRNFLEIDVDNFDDRLKACKPRVAFQVPNTLTGEGNITVEMTFESMGDFSPTAVARKVDSLDKLLTARTQLANLLAFMEGKDGAEKLIAKLLDDPILLQAVSAAPKPEEPAK